MASSFELTLRHPLQIESRRPHPDVSYRKIWSDGATLDVSRADATQRHLFRFLFWGGMSLDIDMSRRTVVDSSPEPMSDAILDHLVNDLVAPRILADDGLFVVHAGAARVDKHALLFLGESGRGKSTLAAKFDREGYPLLGDDAVIIGNEPDRSVVQALRPSLRLLPDSLAALIGSGSESEPVSEFTAKRRVLVRCSEQEPLPVRCVVVLGKPGPDRAIDCRRLSVAEACMTLLSNSFALDPTDRAKARARLSEASTFASRVSTFEVCYPRDYDRLSDVVQAILDVAAEPEHD